MKALSSLVDRVFLRKIDGTRVDPATEQKQDSTITSLGTDGATPPTIAGTGVRGWLRALYDRVTAWTDTDRVKVSPVAGQDGVTAGLGAVDAKTQRVILATDDPLVIKTATAAKQDTLRADLTERFRLAGLTFRATLGATGGGSETHTTVWVDVRDKSYLHLQAQLPATSHVQGIIRTSTADDPAAPTADDITDEADVTLAGSALGGIDNSAFTLNGGAKWAQIEVTNLLASSYEVKVVTDYSTHKPTGASLPLIASLKKDYSAPIGRNVLAAFERGASTSHNLESDASGNLFVRAIPEPLGELTGQERKSGFADNVTADTTLRTVTAGKKFRMTGLTVTFFNTSTVNFGHMTLKDGGSAGTVKESWVIGSAVTGTSPPSVQLTVNFATPMDFETDVFLHMQSGTLRASVRVTGYEEAL